MYLWSLSSFILFFLSKENDNLKGGSTSIMPKSTPASIDNNKHNNGDNNSDNNGDNNSDNNADNNRGNNGMGNQEPMKEIQKEENDENKTADDDDDDDENSAGKFNFRSHLRRTGFDPTRRTLRRIHYHAAGTKPDFRDILKKCKWICSTQQKITDVKRLWSFVHRYIGRKDKKIQWKSRK